MHIHGSGHAFHHVQRSFKSVNPNGLLMGSAPGIFVKRKATLLQIEPAQAIAKPMEAQRRPDVPRWLPNGSSVPEATKLPEEIRTEIQRRNQYADTIRYAEAATCVWRGCDV